MPMTRPRSLSAAFLALALLGLGSMGCVDKLAGDTSGTAVYVYDNASENVKVWNDVNALFVAATPATATATPPPDRVITAGKIANVAPLAWGGLAVDTYTNKLYLVASTGGTVTRIEKVNTQKDNLTQTSDVISFTLGADGDLYAGGTFGQASVNAGTGTLYVTETNSNQSKARIWMVPKAASVANGSTISLQGSIVTNLDAGDKGYAGVAAGQGTMVYGLFPNGNTVTDELGNNGQEGPRLRAGNGLFTNATGVVVGENTLLTAPGTTVASAYGSLAYDSSNLALYVARQDPTGTLPPVLVFTNAQMLGTTLNPAPSRVMGDTAAELSTLRILSHAGKKDWLAGADLGAGSGANSLHLWKSPSAGGKSTPVFLATGVQVGGIALAGGN